MQDSGSESRDIPLHLIDMATAIERIREVAGETNLAALRDDCRRLAILERQVAILSEASRRLNEDEKQLTVDLGGKLLRSGISYGMNTSGWMWSSFGMSAPSTSSRCRWPSRG